MKVSCVILNIGGIKPVFDKNPIIESICCSTLKFNRVYRQNKFYARLSPHKINGMISTIIKFYVTCFDFMG